MIERRVYRKTVQIKRKARSGSMSSSSSSFVPSPQTRAWAHNDKILLIWKGECIAEV